MSFDALTIGGLVVALLSGGFLLGLVRNNDRPDLTTSDQAAHTPSHRS